MDRQTERLARLDVEREKLLQAHYAGAVPLDLLKRERTRIAGEMTACERALSRLTAELGAVEDGLNQALELVTDCHRLYEVAPNHVKPQLNQAVFERILVEDDGVPTARLTPAFGELLTLVDKTATKAQGRDGQTLHGGQPEPEREEWGPARYLRTDPTTGRDDRDIGEAIARIIAERETLRLQGLENEQTPESLHDPGVRTFC